MTSGNIATVAASLLEDVKVYIGATWADDDAEQNIINDIESGIRELTRIGGDSLDFSNNADGSRMLLLAYVMYARSGSLQDFRNNYREELVNLALDSRIASEGADSSEDES